MRWFSSLLLAGALSVASAAAHAEPNAADKETARTFMADAREKRAKGDHKGALESFRAADKIMHVPTTGFEVGRTLVDLGMLIEARDQLLAVSRTTPDPKEPPPFAKARSEAEELAESIAPRIPSIKLTLTGVPAGTDVKVSIDGVPMAGGHVGMRKINPGLHTIVVTGGGSEKTTQVDLAESVTKEVTLDFSDAKPQGSGTSSPGTKDDAASTETRTSPLVWIGFGVAGAGLIAGSVTGLMHLSKVSTIKDQCPNDKCPPSAHDTYDSAKTLSTVSTISFAVAGVGVALGVIGILTPSKVATTSTGAVRVTPWVGLGMAGLNGSF